jgi:hypothetical protein
VRVGDGVEMALDSAQLPVFDPVSSSALSRPPDD